MSKKKYTIDYDNYNEDDVEQEILNSKPTSFLILGKPCTRKKLLAKKLADVWKCVLITAGSIAKEAYTQKLNLPGVQAKHLLLEGESLTEEMMYNFLKLKLMTNAIKHRGYVLVDFPSFFNPSAFQENFMNFITPSPDFIFILCLDSEDMEQRIRHIKVDGDTGDVYFKEQYLAKDSKLQLSKSNVALTSKDEDDEGQDDDEDENEPKNSTANNSTDMNINKNADADTDEEIEDAEAIADEMIKEKEDEEDEDIEEKNEETKKFVNLKKEEIEEEEEISLSMTHMMNREADPKRKEIWDFEYGELQKNYILPMEKVHKLVTPISSKSASIKELNDKLADFDTKIQEMLSRYDPLRVFRLNALKDTDVLLEEILEILKCFHARPAFMVNAFNFSFENIFKKEEDDLMKLPGRKERKLKWLRKLEESGADDQMAQEKDSDDRVKSGYISKKKSLKPKMDGFSLFGKWSNSLLGKTDIIENEEEEENKDQFYEAIRNLNCLSPSWFWHRSIFSHYCPVSLYKGLKISGDVQYAASFLDKVYLFATLNSLKTFYENPRPYLKSPPLKTPGNVVIVGLPYSGRSTLSHLLAKKYNVEVIDVESIHQPMVTNKIENFKKKVTKEIKDNLRLIMANNILTKRNEMRQRMIEKMRENQQNEEEEEEEEEIEEAEEEKEKKEIDENPIGLNLSNKTVGMQSNISKRSVSSKKTSKLDEDGDENEKPASVHSSKTQEDLGSSELKSILENIDISDTNPKVLEYVKERLLSFDSRIPVDTFIQELEKTVHNTHKELSCRLARPIISGGCIFDNFPNDLEYWNAFIKNRYLRPSHIFYLNDSSKRKELVLSQWYKSEKRQINDEILEKLTIHLTDRLTSERIEEFHSLVKDLREMESLYSSDEEHLELMEDTKEIDQIMEERGISETQDTIEKQNYEEINEEEEEEEEEEKEIPEIEEIMEEAENLKSERPNSTIQSPNIDEVEKQDQEKTEKEDFKLANAEPNLELINELTTSTVKDIKNEKSPNNNENNSNNISNNNTEISKNFISIDGNQMLRWTDMAEETTMSYKQLVKLLNEQLNSANKVYNVSENEVIKSFNLFKTIDDTNLYQEDFVTNIIHSNKINKNFNPYKNIFPLNLNVGFIEKENDLNYGNFENTFTVENSKNSNNNNEKKSKKFDNNQSFNRSNNNDNEFGKKSIVNNLMKQKNKDFFSVEKKEKLDKFVSKMSSQPSRGISVNQDLLTTLGLPYDKLLNAAFKDMGFLTDSLDSLDGAQSINRQDNIKSQIDDGDLAPFIPIMIKDDKKHREPSGHGKIHITCLVQQLLGILSYLPLEGPSKKRMNEKISQAVDAWQAISEFLKESPSVQLVNVEIGKELIKENVSEKEFKFSFGEETPKIKDDDAKVAKSSFKSDTENISRAEIDKTVITEEFEKLKKDVPELTFEVYKYFRNLEIDFVELTQQRWEFKTLYEILDEILQAINDSFEFKAQEGIKYQENPHPTLQEVDRIDSEATKALAEQQPENVDNQPKEAIKVEETEDSADKKTNINFGDASYFCPVLLKNEIAWPATQEFSATYREKIYFLSSEEALNTFIKNPKEFVSDKMPLKTPPLRLLITGPNGSGKSTLARRMNSRYGICHIQFKQFLKEMVMSFLDKKLIKVISNVEGLEDEESEAEDFELLDEEEKKEKFKTMEGITWDIASIREDESKEPIVLPMEESKGDLVEETKMTEKEQEIINYLSRNGREMLSDELVTEILNQFWFNTTFSQSGFVLEGYPNNAAEVDQLVRLGFYPSGAIVLNCSKEESTKRLLPEQLKKYRDKERKKQNFNRKLFEYFLEERRKAMEKRRIAILVEKKERLEAHKQQRMLDDPELGKGVRFMGKQDDIDEEEDSQVENEVYEDIDVSYLLQEEFPEVTEYKEEINAGSEAEYEEKVTRVFNELYDANADFYNTVAEQFRSKLIKVIDLESNKRLVTVTYKLNKKLEPFIDDHRSLFEQVVPVPIELAEKMLMQGYKHISRFDRWCPVAIMEGARMQPRPSDRRYAAVHRAFVYFLSSFEARAAFIRDPLKYLCSAPSMVVVPVNVAILGPPKSGKTTIGNRLSEEMALPRYSNGDIIKKILSEYSDSSLANHIKFHLHSGQTVPANLLAKAIDLILLDGRCSTRGYILDGHPNKNDLLEEIEAKKIKPMRVINLQIDEEQLNNNFNASKAPPNDSIVPLEDFEEIFEERKKEYEKSIEQILTWYRDERNILHDVPMEKSRWWVWSKVLEVISEGIDCRRNYYLGMMRNSVASIGGLGITKNEFKQKTGVAEEFCVVSLVENDEYIDCSEEKTIKYAAEYKGIYHRLYGEKQLDLFLNNPIFYTPKAPMPPKKFRPIRRTREQVQANKYLKLGLLGFCPVTYYEGGFMYNSLVRGNKDIVVEYLNTVYYFDSEEKREQFMRSAKKYHNIKEPSIIPPDLPPLKPCNLPLTGYLEQTVSNDLIKALTAVGSLKPKHPFMSAEKTAVIYVALYLKAHNLKLSVFTRQRFHAKLKAFEQRCDLTRYLSTNMGRFFDKDEPSNPGFEKKLEEFFALEEEINQAKTDTNICKDVFHR